MALPFDWPATVKLRFRLCRLKLTFTSFETFQLQIMDAPTISRVFQRLFSHEICSKVRYRPAMSNVISHRAFSQSPRATAGGRPATRVTNLDSDWQQRSDLFPVDKSKEFEKYPMVDSTMLKIRKERPRRVRMLTRDFIEGS